MAKRSDVVKAGIIGLGVGERHIAGYRAHGSCEVKTICDTNPSVAAAMRAKYPEIRVTTDPQDVLHDPEINVVSICSYDDAHRDQVLDALANDKHVFVEKPLCLTRAHAMEIRAALREKPALKLSSNLILRQSPRFIALKEKIDRGEFGELYFIEGDYNYGRVHKITAGWRGRLKDYSMMVGGGVHMVDLLLWLSGELVTHVAAIGNNISTKNSGFGKNDFSVALLKFRSGLAGKVAANAACVHPHFHPLTIYGTKATFRNGMGDGELFTSRDPGVLPVEVKDPYPGTDKGELIPGFVEAILSGSEPPVTAEDVFRSLSICLAIDEASRDGGFIPVGYI